MDLYTTRTEGDPTGPVRQVAAHPRLIKRYANRKYYDTSISRYVNLEAIAEMIRGGVEVKIVENESMRDLTSITLERVISLEARRGSELSAGSLRDLISQGWARSGVAEGSVEEVHARPSASRHRVDALLSQAHREAHSVRQMLIRAADSLSRMQPGAVERVDVASEVALGFARLKRELVRFSRRVDDLHERLRALELAERPRRPVGDGVG